MILSIRRLFSSSTSRSGSRAFEVSQLPNGVRVASANTIPGGPFCSTGILVKTAQINAGAKANPAGTATSYILEKLAFKETSRIGSAEMQRRLDELVGSAMSKSNRESLLISAAILPEQAQKVLQLLGEITLDTVVRQEDLEEMKAVLAYEMGELEGKPDELIPELVHGPAFYGSNQDAGSDRDGNSILSIERALETLRVEDVLRIRDKMMRPGNIFVTAAGIPHDQLHTMASEVFQRDVTTSTVDLNNDPTGVSPLVYRGGEWYISKPDLPLIHLGLGFQGLPAGHPDAYCQAVLQMLLGGGGSFSAGGPGKGMYSRLYTQVLNRHHWIESARVFSQAYRSTGLLGIHGSALPSHAKELTLVLLNQMASLAQQPASHVEFERAKAQVRSAVLMGLESGMTQLEDLADQIVHRGEAHLESPQEICEKIEAVQPEQLQQLTRRILAGGKPSVVAYGPLQKMPQYSAILDWLSNRV